MGATSSAISAALLLLVACGGGTDECFVGDPGMAPEIELILLQPDGTYAPVVEGDVAPIMRPPQGGKMIFPGVRARNLNVCGLRLASSLRDECTGATLSVEVRPATLRATADGWSEPKDPLQISNYGNLPTCPRAAATRDIEGEPYLLTVDVTDQQGRTATASAHVVPTCAEPDLLVECQCECDEAYTLGQVCEPEPDGGPPPGCRDAGP